jgi:hypothetical protein
MKVIYGVSGLLYLAFLLFYNLLGDLEKERDGIFWLNVAMIIVFILLLPLLFRNIRAEVYQELGFYFILWLTCLVCVFTWLVDDYSIFFQFILLINLLTTPVSLNMYKVYFCLLFTLVSFLVRFFNIFYRERGYNFFYDMDLSSVEKENLRFIIVTSSVILGLVLFFLEIWQMYASEKMRRKDFLSREQIKVEKQEADDILTILVPKFVHNKMKK